MERRIDPPTKQAAIEAVTAAVENGLSLRKAIAPVAQQLDVSPSAVYNWMQGQHTGVRARKSLDKELLVLIAACAGNIQAAHRRAVQQGLYSGSYSTFWRQVRDLDTDLAASLTHGMSAMIQKGLYNVRNGDAHRGEVFGFDHTEIPVEVMIKNRRQKPWVTLVVDEATGLIFRPVFTVGETMRGDPNTQSIIASVGSVMIGQELDGTLVGGIPGQFVFDNARAHLADAVRNGYIGLGVAAHTIRPGSPWENGQAEASMRTVEQLVWSTLPGYTHAPDRRFGHSPWSDEDLLSLDELVALTVVGIERLNCTTEMDRHNGQTRLEAWRNDSSPIRIADPALVRQHFMKIEQPRKMQKKGVYFKRTWYQADGPEFEGKVGRTVEVRHVPGDPTFIDVYLDGVFLCTAKPQESRTIEQRQRTAKGRISRIQKAQVIHKRGAQAAREEAERQLTELGLREIGPADPDVETEIAEVIMAAKDDDDTSTGADPIDLRDYFKRGTA